MRGSTVCVSRSAASRRSICAHLERSGRATRQLPGAIAKRVVRMLNIVLHPLIDVSPFFSAAFAADIHSTLLHLSQRQPAACHHR